MARRTIWPEVLLVQGVEYDSKSHKYRGHPQPSYDRASSRMNTPTNLVKDMRLVMDSSTINPKTVSDNTRKWLVPPRNWIFIVKWLSLMSNLQLMHLWRELIRESENSAEAYYFTRGFLVAFGLRLSNGQLLLNLVPHSAWQGTKPIEMYSREDEMDSFLHCSASN